MSYKVNDNISLKLEDTVTVIYIAGEKFRQCKFVVIDIPYIDISLLEGVESVDELLNIKIKNQDTKYLNTLKISPQEKFWVHCSSFQVWAENNYDASLLDSYLAFPILKRLAEVGDDIAKHVFKEEIGKKLKSKVPQVLRFMINEKYTSYLNPVELLYSALVHKEAATIEEISKVTKNLYCVVFDFDELRERFFHIYRGKDELYNKIYFFSAFKGNVFEIELLIDRQHTSIPRVLESLTSLRRLYLYINDYGLEGSNFNIYMESLIHLKIFCFGRVILPNIFNSFPNLKTIEIYGDISGLTQLEVDDDTLEYLNSLKYNFKNVILRKRIL